MSDARPTRSKRGGARLGQPRGAAPKEDRLDDVIAVATRLFRERGFRGTRLDDISDELGVTRAALYYYFDSKREVLEEVCERAMRSTETVLHEVEALDDPAERLRSFARQYARNMSSDAARVFSRDHAELSPPFQRALMARARAVTAGAEQLIAYGVAQGRFRTDLNVHLTTLGLLGMLNSIAEWHRPNRDGALDDVADHLVDVYIDGVSHGAELERPERPGADGRAA
jgi:AcrR family transcriptional regulator